MEFVIFWIVTSSLALMLHIHNSKRDFGDIGGIGLGMFVLYGALCFTPLMGPLLSAIIWMSGLRWTKRRLFDNNKGSGW
jgi:hypothetical protein